MYKDWTCRWTTRLWARALSILVLITLLVGLSPATFAQSNALRAQPTLLALAGAQPNSMLHVIVQKLPKDTAAETAVVNLGGRVTQDFAFINAFAAIMPGHHVARLASSSGVRWVSLDAPTLESGCGTCIDTSKLKSAYIKTVGADRVWATGTGLKRTDVTVAVVDSGISPNPDLNTINGNGASRVKTARRFMPAQGTSDDSYGHGTHIAGVIAGNGARSGGEYIGVAPRANLINVKVMSDQGEGRISDIVGGLQWIYQNHERYNIPVVNLSLNSSVPESYHTSPLSAAVEILWFNRIVVVVSAGNIGSGVRDTPLTPPANDPFVITVGASDDQGTPNRFDDVVATFSAHGKTEDGFAKPDLVAPGTNIISTLSSPDAVLAQEHPDHIVRTARNDYFRMSGTSMAAPVVTGAVALLLENEPDLNPDQVKYRLMATARPIKGAGAGAGQLDLFAATRERTTETANTGTIASDLLWTGSDPVSWSSRSWSSRSWSSVSWSSDYWGD